MPRRERFIVPGMAHHVTQRGNNRQAVFAHQQDYEQYCHWVNKYSMMNGVEVIAFCLMTNHVHFIVIPEDEEGIGRTFNIVQMRHAQYMNKKRKTNGHLWQGRYFSCVLDDQHLYRAIRYVERNPVRAKIVKKPWDYLWSSASWHIGIDQEARIFMKDIAMVDSKDWEEYLKEEDDVFNDSIRKKTQKGFVMGEESLIEKLEKKFGRILREKKAGRPRGEEKIGS